MNNKTSVVYTKYIDEKHQFYSIFRDISKSFGYETLFMDSFHKVKECLKESKITSLFYDNDLESPDLDRLIKSELRANDYFSIILMVSDLSCDICHDKKVNNIIFLSLPDNIFEVSLFLVYKNIVLKDKLKNVSGVVDPDFTKKLLSDTAHAINNILTGMQGYAELAQLNPDDKQLIKDSFQVIIDSSYRIRDEIKNLRAFARVENPQYDIISISNIINETLNLSRIQIRTKDIKILTHTDTKAVIQGDYQQLVQVFFNLLTDILNNFKESGNVDIYFICKENTLNIVIEGKDYDISDSEFKSLQRIFTLDQPVLKMDSKEGKIENRNVLSICNRIIRNHRGSINVTRKVDNTLVYSVELPIFKRLSEIAEIEELPLKPIYQDLENLNMEILVVDDEEYVRNTMFYFFDKKGCRVTVAEDGQYALNIAEKEHFDLIFMDYLMPRMGGIEAAKNILKYDKDVKIVFITGKDTIDEDPLYKSGVYACIKKPFEIKELYEIAKKVSLEKGIVS